MAKFVNVFLFFLLLTNIAAAQNSGFGSLASDRGKPMQFSSDSLIFNQEENFAELFDGVEIKQGKSVLSAQYIKAIYSKTDNKLEKIFHKTQI